uniref:Spermidine/putrescine-binding periplasmic protein n=1 Tax=uncultured bacterium BLR7 TaxID=506523 RepID=C0INQ7_9BACT|nr:spermidine/putrescine-binding periplasmic protein [uncultured bacterium BLR7]
MKVPRWLSLTLAGTALIAGIVYWKSLPPASITVASWGDAYGRAQTMALFHPYTDKSGVDVAVKTYGGGIKEIADQVKTGQIEWDVVDLELEDAAAACREGLLERLEGIELPPGIDGKKAFVDFVPGALGPCWVGSVVYSQVVAFDRQKFPDGAPRRLADFFDLARFPGPRGLRDSGPKINLELALIADGVPPWRVYGTLATQNGANRAFAKLDTIKPAIVWWSKTSEPPDLLTQGKAAMTTTLNARVFSITTEPRIGTIWDGQLYQLDVFGLPKGTANKRRALDFIRFATGSQPLAEEARLLPYGPARRSSLKQVGRNPDTNEEMLSHLPTAPKNFANALAIDHNWWALHGEALQARWAEWRAQPPPSH